jgi:alpha-1,6-mannosyltransferase
VVTAAEPDLAAVHRRGAMSLLALGGLGLLMLVFMAAAPWILRTYDYVVLVPAIVLSGVITIAANALARNVPERAGLILIIAMAVAMRLLVVGEEPFLSTDIYRYVWDGRVQAAGVNPYALVPADEALKSLRDSSIYPNINRADYAVTAYPPVAQMFFFAVTRVSETLTAMRLAMVGCEIAVVAVLIDLLRRLRLPVTAVVAWAWHPLVIWEIANNGHADALMVALLMIGVWLLVRSRRVTGAVAVALAALVKPYAVVVLPAFWRPWDWRAPAAAIAALILCYLPYASAGSGVLGFVTTTGYLSEEGFTDGGGFWLVALVRAAAGDLPGLTVAYMLIGAGVMGLLGLRALSRANEAPQDILVHVGTLLMATLFLMSPGYPWYVLAVVPFVVLGGGAPAWAMTLGAILLYKPAMLPANDLAWKTIATLPFVAAVAVRLLAGRLKHGTRSKGLHGSAPERPALRPDTGNAVVSVVIPCLDEEEPIAGVVREVLAQGVDEVIVVDNGSRDATAVRAREAGARVVSEPRRGYGMACAAGVAAVRADTDIVCFLDGDGSDVPAFLGHIVSPIARGEADFVMGSRLRGKREPGSMTPQQIVAGHVAGALMRLVWGVRFTDMSPFRAMHVSDLRRLGMSETTYGWNLEMQMRATAAGLRILEVPVDHRCRRGGVSKVSGNLTAGLSAAWKITTTFLRLAGALRGKSQGLPPDGGRRQEKSGAMHV